MSERSLDEMAAKAEAMFLARALAAHRVAAAAPVAPAGICANCGERCLPLAIYCDPGCREDHERRERARRAGR